MLDRSYAHVRSKAVFSDWLALIFPSRGASSSSLHSTLRTLLGRSCLAGQPRQTEHDPAV